ncbi:cation diffusion facilitator family transporter [Virgifigura deserti]|uniref:cation diffusion facilitator family transporter n=1 Tax=Virgifigura deserti TaxID=2268457 RepID=UPI003CCBEBAF
MASHGSKRVICAALAGNLAIACTKFAAASWTGSSAMLSEGIHSIVDTSNQGLLLFDLRRAARPADENHPFGHGIKIHFWAIIVALLIFALGGIALAYVFDEPIFDGMVSIGIGAVLVLIAVFLARETLSLMTGGRLDRGGLVRPIRSRL